MNSGDRVRVLVLGAGRVGALIARDLALDPGLRLRAVDRSPSALEPLRAEGMEVECADLSDGEAITRLSGTADLVIGAVPGALGFGILRAVLQAGRPIVDISFMPEDPLALDEEARRQGVPVVVDCGVAPGLSNWFVGRSSIELDEVDTVDIYVGGLPRRRVWPYEYRAVFSPADVIEEYVRPCRMRENGVEVVVPALSGVERMDFEEVGTLEAFYTDGLRSLLRTSPARTLREKTLRYPGHAEKMSMLRETGFFETEPIDIGGVRVAPRAFTESLLFPRWALEPGEEELTILRVAITGRRADRISRTRWDLVDRTDRVSGTTSMARTTGYPCAIVARLLAERAFERPGVHPPETLGSDQALTVRLLAELAARGIRVDRSTTAA